MYLTDFIYSFKKVVEVIWGLEVDVDWSNLCSDERRWVW
jgi:hypothetical protein